MENEFALVVQKATTSATHKKFSDGNGYGGGDDDDNVIRDAMSTTSKDEVKDEETKYFQKMVFANGLFMQTSLTRTASSAPHNGIFRHIHTHARTHVNLPLTRHHIWDLGSVYFAPHFINGEYEELV